MWEMMSECDGECHDNTREGKRGLQREPDGSFETRNLKV